MSRTKGSITRAAESGLKLSRLTKCRNNIKRMHPNLKLKRVAYWTYKMYNLLYKDCEQLAVSQIRSKS